METRIVLALCPEVRVYDDAVVIGEGDAFVRLPAKFGTFWSTKS